MHVQPLTVQNNQTKSKSNIISSNMIPNFFSKDLIALSLLVCFSFIFDLFSLTRYPLSYGRDGAFYNIQVRQILNYGFPNSGDPPVVYYLMAFFAILFGVTLGIKVAMVLFCSLM